jgi:hypothetical protein
MTVVKLSKLVPALRTAKLAVTRTPEPSGPGGPGGPVPPGAVVTQVNLTLPAKMEGLKQMGSRPELPKKDP